MTSSAPILITTVRVARSPELRYPWVMEDQWEKLLPLERDALVAEKVMGLKKGAGRPVAGYIEHGVGPKVIFEWPRYSADIAAAWEVVEHMRRFHFRDVFSLVSPTDDCRYWRAMFSKKWAVDMDSYPSDMGKAETAPQAICLAALNAVARYLLA